MHRPYRLPACARGGEGPRAAGHRRDWRPELGKELGAGGAVRSRASPREW